MCPGENGALFLGEDRVSKVEGEGLLQKMAQRKLVCQDSIPGSNKYQLVLFLHLRNKVSYRTWLSIVFRSKWIKAKKASEECPEMARGVKHLPCKHKIKFSPRCVIPLQTVSMTLVEQLLFEILVPL